MMEQAMDIASIAGMVVLAMAALLGVVVLVVLMVGFFVEFFSRIGGSKE